MMNGQNVVNNVNKVNTYVQDIKNAINLMGVPVNTATPLSTLSSKIKQISTVHNQEKEITDIGTYIPDKGYTGFSSVSVNIDWAPKLQPLIVTENGDYTPPEGYKGFSDIQVAVYGDNWIPLVVGNETSYPDSGYSVVNLSVDQTAFCEFTVNGAKLVPIIANATSWRINVANGSTISYKITKNGYKPIKNTIKVESPYTEIYSLEEATSEEIIIEAPFTDNSEYLQNLVDGSNFEISGDYIQSGSKSWNVDYGNSQGYITFTTPDVETTLSVICKTDSEQNYDFGGIYVGTQIYNITSNNQISDGQTDGNGSWLYISRNESNNTLVEKSMQLQPNTTYYVMFAYAKDSSANNGADRFFIQQIKFEASLSGSNLTIPDPDNEVSDTKRPFIPDDEDHIVPPGSGN